MSTPVAWFPFTLLMDDDQFEPKHVERINDHINSLMQVGRWHHMDEDAQRALDTQVLDAVREMHMYCIRENLHLSYLQVALYDSADPDVPDEPRELKVEGNPPWIKLLSINSPN